MSEALPPGIETVAVCVPDHFGRLIGKRVPAERWPEVRERGLPMPNFHLVTGAAAHSAGCSGRQHGSGIAEEMRAVPALADLS